MNFLSGLFGGGYSSYAAEFKAKFEADVDANLPTPWVREQAKKYVPHTEEYQLRERAYTDFKNGGPGITRTGTVLGKEQSRTFADYEPFNTWDVFGRFKKMEELVKDQEGAPPDVVAMKKDALTEFDHDRFYQQLESQLRQNLSVSIDDEGVAKIMANELVQQSLMRSAVYQKAITPDWNVKIVDVVDDYVREMLLDDVKEGIKKQVRALLPDDVASGVIGKDIALGNAASFACHQIARDVVAGREVAAEGKMDGYVMQGYEHFVHDADVAGYIADMANTRTKRAMDELATINRAPLGGEEEDKRIAQLRAIVDSGNATKEAEAAKAAADAEEMRKKHAEEADRKFKEEEAAKAAAAADAELKAKQTADRLAVEKMMAAGEAKSQAEANPVVFAKPADDYLASVEKMMAAGQANATSTAPSPAPSAIAPSITPVKFTPQQKGAKLAAWTAGQKAEALAKARAYWAEHPEAEKVDKSRTAKIVRKAAQYDPAKNDFAGVDTRAVGIKEGIVKFRR